jgi:hypothetical protein
MWLTAAGLIVSAGALVFAAYGISQQRKWERKHFAVEMINEWNNQSSNHKAAIENAYPELFTNDGPLSSRPRMTSEEAHLIYTSTEAKDKVRWETRNHCIALLNYFEFVASAWDKEIADREIIEDSFKSTILRWHHDLEEFMIEMKKTRQYEPWPPLQSVVAQWKAHDAKLSSQQN